MVTLSVDTGGIISGCILELKHSPVNAITVGH